MAERDPQSLTRESLRELIAGKEAGYDFDAEKRDIHIMTRLSERVVRAIDALVVLNVFKSRSEAVAAYVENAILKNNELYESLILKATQIARVRDRAMDSIRRTLDDDEESD